MSKRDTRRALTRLFADRDDAVMAYAFAYLEKEKLKRRIVGLDDELRDLKRKARECGARAGDLEAAERAMLQDLDDDAAEGTDGVDGTDRGPERDVPPSDDGVSAGDVDADDDTDPSVERVPGGEAMADSTGVMDEWRADDPVASLGADGAPEGGDY